MPSNKSALLRYRIIDNQLRNKFRKFPSIDEIRDKCEEELFGDVSVGQISKSTIEKDIEAMRNDTQLGYNAPIAYNRAHGGYHYTDPDYSIDKLGLNDAELEAIKLAAQTLHQFRETPLMKNLQVAIGKIFDRTSLAAGISDKDLVSVIQFETATSFKGSELLPELFDATKNQIEVAFLYDNIYKQTSKTYHCQPYLLKEYRNRWYLICFSPERKDFLTFGLDRISELKLTEKTFKRRNDFNPDFFFKYSIGITESAAEPVRITLQFPPHIGKLIKAQPLHATQHLVSDTPKALIIEIEVLLCNELYALLMGYGDNVKVLKPSSVVKEIKKRLKEALEVY